MPRIKNRSRSFRNQQTDQDDKTTSNCRGDVVGSQKAVTVWKKEMKAGLLTSFGLVSPLYGSRSCLLGRLNKGTQET